MLPPSPDVFPPHLEEIRTRTRVRVELAFDEDIEPKSLTADSFAVSRPDGTRLEVRGAALGRRTDRVELWTQVQEPVVYEVRGVVRDASGNSGRFRSRFKGSDRADTVPPTIADISPEPGSGGQTRFSVRVRFSEPVDTLSQVNWVVMPVTDTMREDQPEAKETKQDNAGQRWEPDWQQVSLFSPDTLDSGTVVYVVLLPGIEDLEANRLEQPGYTYFTPDSVLEAEVVSGTVAWTMHDALRTTPAAYGLVFFESSGVRAVAPVLSDGSFATRLLPGEYEAFAVADTNSDRVVDLVSERLRFIPGADTLRLDLEPESLPRPIDAYYR